MVCKVISALRNYYLLASIAYHLHIICMSNRHVEDRLLGRLIDFIPVMTKSFVTGFTASDTKLTPNYQKLGVNISN